MQENQKEKGKNLLKPQYRSQISTFFMENLCESFFDFLFDDLKEDRGNGEFVPESERGIPKGRREMQEEASRPHR